MRLASLALRTGIDYFQLIHADWEDVRAIELAVEEGGDWDRHTELLAVLVEVMDGLRVNHIAANSKKGARVPKPLSVPRPYEDDGKAARK